MSLSHDQYKVLLEQYTTLIEEDPSPITNLPLAQWYEQYQMPFGEFIIRNARRLAKTKTTDRLYLITFTHNNNHERSLFKAAVTKQLNRAIFTHVRYAFEHEETNIHCHALCDTRFTLGPQNFSAHTKKYGHVDVKMIHEDNGLEEYISKENPIQIITKTNLGH